MKPFKPFKKTNKFGPRDKEKVDRRAFKTFDRNDSGKFGERSDRPSRNDRPNRSFGSKESRSGNGFKLHEAVCDKCGNKCDLPFEPTGSKPIYCRSCFRETKGSSGENFQPRGRSNDRFERKDSRFNKEFESKEQSVSSDDLDKINRKLDKIMKALKIE